MRMASIDFMRASVESEYTEEMYSSVQYEKLETALNDICKEL